MNDESLLRHVSVLGAAGKMGSGIALLVLQEQARQEAESSGNVGSGNYRLNLIDSHDEGLVILKKYLRAQLTKYAEKQINQLRSYFARNPHLVSNEEIVNVFVSGAMDIIRCDTEFESAKNSTLIFEAVSEDISLKTQIFYFLNDLCSPHTLFLTNTSSIPIGLLNRRAHVDHRILGFHFYNPPAVQKLVEVIYPEGHKQKLEHVVHYLAKHLGKTIVESKDVAGFIGNGHFIREVVFATNKADELSETYALPQAIYMINKVTQDYLLRPMGIFQLIDYVGIDVCQKIAFIMSTHLPDPLIYSELLHRMLKAGIVGGRAPDGSQKAGFFNYAHSKPVEAYDLNTSTYIPIEPTLKEATKQALGNLPEAFSTWKQLQHDPSRHDKSNEALKTIFYADTFGAQLAHDFLKNSQRIARLLLANEVSHTMEDLTTVLEQGFFHLYGPNLPVEQWTKKNVPSANGSPA